MLSLSCFELYGVSSNLPLVDGFTDDDWDGMPDEWERLYDVNGEGLEPDENNESILFGHGATDFLTNLEEYQAGTRPDLLDTDNDGILDGDELYADGTHGDLDGVQTDPLNPDSDFDTINDGDEISLGLDPNDPSDALEDSDNDGFRNYQEYAEGTDLWDPEDFGTTPDYLDYIPSGPTTIPFSVTPEGITLSIPNEVIAPRDENDPGILTGPTDLPGGSGIDFYTFFDVDSSSHRADGWYESSWFGWFTISHTDSSWIYHEAHGWLYVHPLTISANGIWMWSPQMNWIWVQAETSLRLYFADYEGWVFFFPNSISPRWFFPEFVEFGSWVSLSSIDSHLDFDKDGMGDLWEFEYFSNLGNNGLGDYDLDGIPDRREYELGLSPLIKNSPDEYKQKVTASDPRLSVTITDPIEGIVITLP